MSDLPKPPAYKIPPQQPPQYNPPPPRKSSGMMGCIIAIVIVVGIMGLMFVSSVVMQAGKMHQGSSLLVENTLRPGSGGKVAVIRVYGAITSSEGGFSVVANSTKILEQLKAAESDDEVKAIIFDINTPGGEVVATDEIYQEVLRLRNKGIRVVCYMRDMATSGGYYLAAGTDHIVAHRMTMTGSIGVIMGTINYHGLLEKIGIKPVTYKKGELKDIGNPARDPNPKTDAEKKRIDQDREIFEHMITQVYNDFTLIVAEGRNMPIEKVRAAPIGDSRVISGVDALELGLVDEVGFFNDAIDAATQGNAYSIIEYRPPPSLLDALNGQAVESDLNKTIQGLTPNTLKLEKGKMYFLPTFYE
ncbi:MAG: signal peptide peptidase SppA [Lentisphaeria bacterium]|nr:signal peptide peptidase SppA [Lentisphaeria bacterium]